MILDAQCRVGSCAIISLQVFKYRQIERKLFVQELVQDHRGSGFFLNVFPNRNLPGVGAGSTEAGGEPVPYK